MRIIQISDTHLTDRLPYFRGNVAAVADWLRGREADLVVHTGDVAMDGAGHVDDLRVAARWNAALGLPVLSVPGNHDVGDTAEIRPDQEIDQARLERWRDEVGDDRWVLDREGWRLIGLNAMLMGSGHADEARQVDWFAGALDHAGPIAVFLHKPLYIDDPDEGPRGYWAVRPEPRRRLLALMKGRDVRLVGSGHLHIARHADFAGTQHVWAPSSAFVVGGLQERLEERLGGERRLGVVEYEFGKDTVTASFLRPDGLVDDRIDDVIHEIYPKPAATGAR
jgi:3',5'-cyclic AMP phosphodiesterase CpdA